MFELLILLLGALRATLRSRADLVAENLLLHQQLAVLTHPGWTRPPLRTRDKVVWILARRLCWAWRRLVLARPETVVRWHRRGGGSSGGGDPAAPSAVGNSASKCAT